MEDCLCEGCSEGEKIVVALLSLTLDKRAGEGPGRGSGEDIADIARFPRVISL